MKCVICKKEVYGFIKVDINDTIKAHIDCFFEDIPYPVSSTDPNQEDKFKERRKLIDDKIERLIKENTKE